LLGNKDLIAPLDILNGIHPLHLLGFSLIKPYLTQLLIWWLQAVVVVRLQVEAVEQAAVLGVLEQAHYQ
jgi:hypothetical protein